MINFTSPIRKMSLSLIFGLVFICPEEGGAQTQDAIKYAFSESVLCNRLAGTWMVIVSNPRIDYNLRRDSAASLYAFLFLNWLVTVYQNEPELLTLDCDKFILTNVEIFKIQSDDPLELLSMYQGDNLSVAGGWLADAQPLARCSDVFQHKTLYVQLVKNFQLWRDGLKLSSQPNHTFLGR
jgi:hypothetical protein